LLRLDEERGGVCVADYAKAAQGDGIFHAIQHNEFFFGNISGFVEPSLTANLTEHKILEQNLCVSAKDRWR
jgi:hypothetical protein